jgi:hypothetical protein
MTKLRTIPYALCVAHTVHLFPVSFTRGLINYIDTSAKCRHLIKLTFKGVYQTL